MGNIRHVRAEKEDDCHYSETKPGQASSNALPEPQQNTCLQCSASPDIVGPAALDHLSFCFLRQSP